MIHLYPKIIYAPSDLPSPTHAAEVWARARPDGLLLPLTLARTGLPVAAALGPLASLPLVVALDPQVGVEATLDMLAVVRPRACLVPAGWQAFATHPGAAVWPCIHWRKADQSAPAQATARAFAGAFVERDDPPCRDWLSLQSRLPSLERDPSYWLCYSVDLSPLAGGSWTRAQACDLSALRDSCIDALVVRGLDNEAQTRSLLEWLKPFWQTAMEVRPTFQPSVPRLGILAPFLDTVDAVIVDRQCLHLKDVLSSLWPCPLLVCGQEPWGGLTSLRRGCYRVTVEGASAEPALLAHRVAGWLRTNGEQAWLAQRRCCLVLAFPASSSGEGELEDLRVDFVHLGGC